MTYVVGDISSLRPCELLVAVINQRSDFEILSKEHWYRIPTDVTRGRWRPKWLALYQTADFGPEGKAVNYYARVEDISEVSRQDLFPGRPRDAKAGRRYYKLQVSPIIPLERPIPLLRPRPLAFIPSTLDKLMTATQINDLWHVSPLEERLWKEFKARGIPAERQWEVEIGKVRYYLDFALLCNKGKVDVETDGSTWHKNRSEEDNERNNAVESVGWHVLRFNTRQIQERAGTYCIFEVERAINTFGGPEQNTFAPTLFYELPEGPAQQLALFEDRPSYDLD